MESGTRDAGKIRRWLGRIDLFLLAVLLLLSIHLVWRLTILTYRLDHTVAALSDDVKQVTETAAIISCDVAALREGLGAIKDKLAQSIPLGGLKSALDAALTIGGAVRADSSALDPAAESEIKALLTALLYSGMRYDDDGKQRSVTRIWTALYTKYKVMRKGLVSAEDFIDKVATRSVLGNTYYLLDKDGERVALRDWMLEALRNHREVRQSADSPAGPSR